MTDFEDEFEQMFAQYERNEAAARERELQMAPILADIDARARHLYTGDVTSVEGDRYNIQVNALARILGRKDPGEG